MARADLSVEEFILAFAMVAIMITAATITNFLNVRDMQKGYRVQTVATVWDFAFVGRSGTPVMVIKKSDNEYLNIHFENENDLYSCGEKRDILPVTEYYGKSGKLRELEVFCKSGLRILHKEFLHLEVGI